jgi:hypothetical protein
MSTAEFADCHATIRAAIYLACRLAQLPPWRQAAVQALSLWLPARQS